MRESSTNNIAMLLAASAYRGHDPLVLHAHEHLVGFESTPTADQRRGTRLGPRAAFLDAQDAPHGHFPAYWACTLPA